MTTVSAPAPVLDYAAAGKVAQPIQYWLLAKSYHNVPLAVWTDDGELFALQPGRISWAFVLSPAAVLALFFIFLWVVWTQFRASENAKTILLVTGCVVIASYLTVVLSRYAAEQRRGRWLELYRSAGKLRLPRQNVELPLTAVLRFQVVTLKFQIDGCATDLQLVYDDGSMQHTILVLGSQHQRMICTLARELAARTAVPFFQVQLGYHGLGYEVDPLLPAST